MESAEKRAHWGRPDPAGSAPAAPFASPSEFLEDLLDTVRARVGAAVRARWESGLLASQGDAAAALFLDRARVEAMLAPLVPAATAAATEAGRVAAEARTSLHFTRARASNERRVAIPLLAAFEAWKLDDGERLLLACVLGTELSPALSRLLAYLGGDATRPGLTVEAAAAALSAGEGGVLSLSEHLGASATLRRLSLVSIKGNADLPLLRRTLHAAPRLFNLARGVISLDEALSGATLHEDSPHRLVTRHLAEEYRAAIGGLCRRDRAGEPVGVLACRRDSGAEILLTAAAHAMGRATIVARTSTLPLDEESLRALVREALLHRSLVVLVDDGGAGAAREGQKELRPSWPAWIDRLAELPLPVVIVLESMEAPTPRSHAAVVRVDLPLPDATTRFHLWSDALADRAADDVDLEAIASTYHVGAETIERAVAGATTIAAGRKDAQITAEDVSSALRAQVAADLSVVASRLPISQRWEDLVLPADQSELVWEFVDRARHRRRVLVDWGFGRKVGKGHGLIARELGLDAYQIDISRVVSKWIGETEKALAAAFEAAESGQALLIFDEADALFGKRISDAKTATDRYANVETNYILNRLEWFTGIAVLTTNLEGNLDAAFRRRISIHMQFPFPDDEQRALLWQTIIPEEAELAGDFDFARLGREWKLSGGQIRNIALRAAYLAASAGEPLSMGWIRMAAERQYAAHGKLTVGGELD